MRKWLNNPVVVLPLALLALLWVAYSYGLFDYLLGRFVGQPKAQAAIVTRLPEESASVSKGELAMKSLISEPWLITNWVRASVVKNEPFVANGFITDPELPMPIPVENAEEVVIIDQQTFEAALVSSLGLDRYGYFVTFENILNLPVRKRVGDEIYLKESGALIIPTFGIAETRRSPEQLRALAGAIVAELRLLGVGTDEANDDMADASDNSKNIAFIQGSRGQMGIFKQGQLVSRDPNLGLDKIFKGEGLDRVILVDQYANEYELKSAPAPGIK
ncbi:MAG: hypothetical protein ACPGIC_07645 [Opitutales bacterium]